MAELPILIVALFFGAVTWLAAHAWIVVPVLVAAWLLLFVPDSAWASLRRSIGTTGSLTAREVAPVDRPQTATDHRAGRNRELVHSH